MDTERRPKWRPRGVSFSSGGVLVTGHLGVMMRLLEAGTLDDVRDWYGCSGGSFCALYGAIGVSAAWIRDAVEYFDTRIIAGVEEENVVDFLSCWGVNSGVALKELIGKFLDTWEPDASKWTFADFAANRPSVSLHITATNVTKGTLEVFNLANTPDVLVLDAVRASCAVPCFFTPWTKAGELFCDGSLLESYPWVCVEDKANTLVVACYDNGLRRIPTPLHKIESFGDYIKKLSCLLQEDRHAETPKNWIAINNITTSALDFHITKDERLKLFREGITAAEGWLAFREKAVSSGIRETPLPTEGPCASLSCRPSQSKTSDSHPPGSPSPTPCRSLDLCSGGPRPRRRWSL